jgi:hypothetical protein
MSDALSPVSAVLAKGKTLGEVLTGLVKPKKAEKPTKVALPAKLTEADKEAIAQLIRVYGQVCPQDRVTLTPAQLTAIMSERLVLDQVEKIVKNRKEGVRTTVLNHIDIALEVEGSVNDMTPLEKDGHYLLAGTHQVPAPDTHMVWSWEVSPGTPDINPAKLYDLCHSEGSGLTHKDWLAMTFQPEVVDPPRKFDEAKAMAHLQAHPELLEHLEDAMDVPEPRGAFWPRKEKA